MDEIEDAAIRRKLAIIETRCEVLESLVLDLLQVTQRLAPHHIRQRIEEEPLRLTGHGLQPIRRSAAARRSTLLRHAREAGRWRPAD